MPITNGSGTIIVGTEAVRRDLVLIGSRGMAQALDENISSRLVALSYGNVEHQLGMALNGYEGVAIPKAWVIVGPNSLLFFANERPNFITLHVPNFNTSDLLGHDPLAFLASEN